MEYAYPCGICRQVMQEFCMDDFVIYVVKNEQDYQSYTLKELLPYGFGGEAIRRISDYTMHEFSPWSPAEKSSMVKYVLKMTR